VFFNVLGVRDFYCCSFNGGKKLVGDGELCLLLVFSRLWARDVWNRSPASHFLEAVFLSLIFVRFSLFSD
jgi:hypothetical protein